MATRTITQQGQAYGATTASITASINGTEIFSGPVLTLDQPPPPMPGTQIVNNLFSWTVDTSFTGSQTLSISVLGSLLILADTQANYILPGNVAADQGLSYWQTIDSQEVVDPFTNVTIDGSAQTRGSQPTGQWYWLIQPGQTFQATVNITAAIDYPLWDPAISYGTDSNVIYNNVCYSNGINTAAAGLAPDTNPLIWYTIPIQVWQADQSYPIYSRVQNAAPPTAGYMALQNVPAGTPLTDTNYWQLRYTK